MKQETEFNLSEKREYIKEGSSAGKKIYFEEDVKEFIKKLKEELEKDAGLSQAHYNRILDRIDKLAGDKLVNQEKEK